MKQGEITEQRFLRRTGLRMNDFALLQRVPFLTGLKAAETYELLADATVREHSRGTLLFAREEPADRFFIILDGWVKLSRETRDGHESVIGLFSRGESFAEAAMFESETFPVDGTAIETTRLLTIPAGSFRRRLSERPELMFKLMGSMSKHMRGLVRQIEQLTARTSAQRLAGFLASLARNAEPPVRLHLPVDKVLIAGRLGMQPETFSRALARLRRHGVHVDGHDVAIDDLHHLRQLAEGEER
ncbi:MAG: Crp/Fnr family transcriptional regulator [Alphaproteobacteria bacterium]|nr:Crp/Fnr family transcriptional regulator [Alphaproteobacteria bacterium]